MMRKIWKIIVWILGLFRKRKPWEPTGKKVTNVWVEYDETNKPVRKKVRYDDGTEEILPINPDDPTGENEFLGNLDKH